MNRQVRRPASENTQISYDTGIALISRRQNAGISRKKAAVLSGVKHGTIESIEMNHQAMTLTVTLEKLNDFYKSRGV